MDNRERITAGNLYWKDKQGKYLSCNENFARLAGLDTPEDIIGKTDRDLFLKFLGENGVKAIIDLDQNVIATGKEHIAREIGINEFEQAVTYISIKSPLKDEENNIIGVVGTSINSTDYDYIKDYIISHTAGNLYWKSISGCYLGCNETFAQVLKLDSPLAIVGKNDYDFFLDAERVNKIIETDKTVMEFGAEITVEEVGTGMDGNLATYLTKKMPLKDANGNIIGLVGTSIDITKQKQAELVKAEFLKNMSHDIRTPLVGIYSLAAMLYEEETDPEKRNMLADMVESSERLTALLNQILEVSNLNNYAVQNTIFNISDILEENVGLLLASIKSKKLSFNLENKDALVKTDRERLNRILTNLLSNAVKFTPEGGIINIILESTSPFLCINIEDTGIGIPQDKLEAIFEKFTKLAPSHTKPRFSGSGVGLFIVKQYVTELGGEITVDSQLGKGSKFSIIIPNLI